MKLRQKLAVVLASAMVVSAVPVVTMANSKNTIYRGSSAIKEDSKTVTAGYLNIKFEDRDTSSEDYEEFYLEVTNADWLKMTELQKVLDAIGDDYKAGITTNGRIANIAMAGVANKFDVTFADGTVAHYTRQSDSTMKIQVKPGVTNQAYTFPLPIKATGGTVSVATKIHGSNASITEGSYSFATTGDKAAKLQMASTESFYDEGELTKMYLDESFVGSLTSDDTLILKVQLDDTDWEFSDRKSKVRVKGTYGFDFDTNAANCPVDVTLSIDDEDDDNTAYVIIEGLAGLGRHNSKGRLEITGLHVSADEDEDLTTGDLKADIDLVSKWKGYTSELEFDGDYDNTVVATIANYGAAIVMEDEKAVDAKAGREEEVTFKVKENVDDCFVEGRKITIKPDNDGLDKSWFMVDYKEEDGENVVDYTDLIDDIIDDKDIIESVEMDWDTDDDLYFQTGSGADQRVVKIDVDDAREGVTYRRKADGIIITLQNDLGEDKKSLNENEDKDWFKVKVDLYTALDDHAAKKVDLVGSVRGVDDEDFTGCTAINVIDPIKVAADATTVKVGLQDQPLGTIEITENDKEMLEKGSLYFAVNKGSDINYGFAIDEKGTLTATGSLKTDDFDKIGVGEEFYLKRTSDEASSVKIEGAEVTVDRTVPQGFYDLEIRGTAIDDYDGKYKVADFIKVGTANTQDINNANGLAAVEAKFTIGSTKFVVNDEAYEMDAPAYIAGEGYTMIPMRYIAKAFGVPEKNILFSNGVATFFAGTRTIQLTSGSDVALVNGAPIHLSTKVVNKEGRMFVPVGEVANLLGVNKAWDSASKTATFSNTNVAK